MKKSFSALTLQGIAACLLFAPVTQATTLNPITSTINEFDGPDSTGFTYPQPALLIGTFSYTIPTGDYITGASVAGFFGTSAAPTTALENLYVAGINVANCSSTSDPCFTAQNQTAWSYTFTTEQLESLAGGSAAYTVVQTGDFFVESGSTTLTINVAPTPEPATFVLIAGGLAVLPFVRRKLEVR